ncbi:MAG TPA: acetylornithine deacetylase [Gammaproteobacteria bacterium]|nr:acetylornithine deacetylase [Gammaproteobacteria bacterium]
MTTLAPLKAQLGDQLGRLVAMRSVSSGDPRLDCGNRGVVELLADWCAARGFAIELQPVGRHPDKLNLIATRGAGDDGLVLAGHTDTVPCDPALWTSDPFVLSERDGRWYGLGTADMKCLFPAALAAVDRLEGAARAKPLTILATADEETSMAGARALVAAGRRLGRYAIIGEPTGGRPIAAHKGVAQLGVALAGKSGHASNPALGNNALDGMRQVLNALAAWREDLARTHRCEDFDVPQPTLNFGAIRGGDNANRICGHCELLLDLRFVPGQDPAATIAALRARVAAAIADSGLGCEVRELMEAIPAHATPREGALVRLAESITGQRAGAVSFATEAPFLTALGVETIVLGPGHIAQAHQPDEYVEIDALLRMVERLAQFIARLCSP